MQFSNLKAGNNPRQIDKPLKSIDQLYLNRPRNSSAY